jgi:hypothetical protein
MKPVAFLGTETDVLLGRTNLNNAVLEKYNYFNGHKYVGNSFQINIFKCQHVVNTKTERFVILTSQSYG